MYLCRNIIGMSLTDIAKLLEKKDHTTVIHGIKKITTEIETDEDIKNKVDIIKKKINPS